MILQHVWDRVSALESNNLMDVRPMFLVPAGDGPLIQILKRESIPYFEDIVGEEDDVLGRYVRAAEAMEAEGIVRVTCDCPFIPTDIIGLAAINLHETAYCANTIIRTYPDGWDTQACTMRALRWFDKNQQDQREHPFFPFDYNASIRQKFLDDGFTFKHILNEKNVIFQKFSVDTEEDLKHLEELNLQK